MFNHFVNSQLPYKNVFYIVYFLFSEILDLKSLKWPHLIITTGKLIDFSLKSPFLVNRKKKTRARDFAGGIYKEFWLTKLNV